MKRLAHERKQYTVNNIIPAALLLVFTSFFTTSLHAKGIALDSIYISRTSPVYTRLLHARLDSYSAVSAAYADKSIISAEWITGNDIVYIKELDSGLNMVYRYSIHSRKKRSIFRFRGTLIAERILQKAGFMVIKYFDASHPPRVKTILLDCNSGKAAHLPLGKPSIDFTVTPGGSALLFYSGNGIYSMDTSIRTHHLKIPAATLRRYTSGGNPVLLFQSPAGNNSLFLDGEAGSYRGIIKTGHKTTVIKDITSSTELFWTDNNSILYRNGGPGSYNVVLHEINTGRSRYLLKGSIDTCITYQHDAQTAAFCRDQMLYLFDTTTGDTSFTGLETDEARIAPGGQYLSSLLYGKLFILNRNQLLKKQVILGRYWKKLLSLYTYAGKKKEWHKNGYSSRYIARRKNIYRKLLSE